MEANPALPLWQAVFTAVIGAFYILAGYRTMRFTARVTSALLFVVVGALVASHVTRGPVAAAIIAGAGILGFLFGNAFYFVTVSLYGAAAGAVLGLMVGGAFVHAVCWPAILGGAVAAGFLAILFERPIGIVATSVIGAGAVTRALASLVGGMAAHPGNQFPLHHAALVVGLAVLGCVVQSRTTRDLPPREASAKTGPR